MQYFWQTFATSNTEDEDKGDDEGDDDASHWAHRSVSPVGLSSAGSSPPGVAPAEAAELLAALLLLVYFLRPLYSVLLSSSRTVVAPDWMPESDE